MNIPLLISDSQLEEWNFTEQLKNYVLELRDDKNIAKGFIEFRCFHLNSHLCCFTKIQKFLKKAKSVNFLEFS